MHEVGIMESALALVARHAAGHGDRRVSRVVLRIGALAGVEIESLRFAFDVVSRGTVAEGADFEIEEVPVAVYCHGCQRSSPWKPAASFSPAPPAAISAARSGADENSNSAALK